MADSTASPPSFRFMVPPMQHNSRPPNLKEDLEQIRNWTGIVAVLVTLLTVGLQAAVLKLLDLEDAIELANLFLRTAPLTISVALVAYATIREWFEHLYAWILYFAVVLGTATSLGETFGGMQVVPVQVVPHSVRLGAINGLVNLLAGYCVAYTWPVFTSSLILGMFLAWVWLRLARRIRQVGNQTLQQTGGA